MGGALGLATLASLATSRTDSLLAAGDAPLAALNGGYHAAFIVGALFAVAAAVIGAALLRTTTTHEHRARESENTFGVPAVAERD
jgi:membrane protein implicated in regulation of membrane protease activity